MLGLLFPRTCLLCNRWGSSLCSRCYGRFVPLVHDWCYYCGKRAKNGITHQECRRKRGFDGVQSWYYYNSAVKKLISQIKYANRFAYYEEVLYQTSRVGLAKNSWYQDEKNLVLQPIPLHRHKERTRGFNQAEVLAEYLSGCTGRPMVQAVHRVRNTAPQAHTSSRVHRHYNTLHAFSVYEPQLVSGKDVVVVDDVLTSGNTAKEVVSVLKSAGANNVYLFTYACL
ncbi:MAG: phosphoribosyltransferase family protein [Patescibacteria group bacterium]